MAIGSNRTRHIRDAAITAAKLGASAVTSAKINDLAVTTAKIADNAVTVAKLPADTIQTTTISLTNAEMLALRATPKSLVAAPGAGKVLQFLGAVVYQLNVGGYTETADNLAIKYTNTAGASASTDIETTGFVDQTSAQYRCVTPINNAAAVANAALVLAQTGDGEFGGGNAGNVTKVMISYRVVTLP